MGRASLETGAPAALACQSWLTYGVLTMERYGITVEQMSAHGKAAVRAAERLSANTVVYRDQVAVAAIVPAISLARLEPPDPGAGGEDPLLSLCGTCTDDAFVDQLGELGTTMLFRRY